MSLVEDVQAAGVSAGAGSAPKHRKRKMRDERDSTYTRFHNLLSDEINRAARLHTYNPTRVDAVVTLLFDDWIEFITDQMAGLKLTERLAQESTDA